MRENGRIGAAIEALEQIFAFEQPADNTLNLYFRSRRYIGGGDRRHITELVWAVLRRYGRYNTLADPLTARVAVALYLRETGKDPADCFTGDQYAPSVLTDAENVSYRFVSETAECPAWLKDRIDPADVAAMTAEAPTDLRVNTLKTTRADVLKALADANIDAVAAPLSPVGVRLAKRVALADTELYRNGMIEIQDEGSQLVSLLCGARDGDTVIDWCAGAGGKTLALSAAMNAGGTIYALDANKARLRDLPERARRADAANVILVDGYDGLKKADIVLVDAPCTGTGTWRRSPDAKWRVTEEQSKQLVGVQAGILEKAAKHVKKGGRLFYVTCSLDAAENEGQIADFIQKHPEFSVENLQQPFFEITGRRVTSESVRLRPSVFSTDGFFAASLRLS